MVLELKNIKENQNSLFDRNEIKADVELDITPSREDALKAVCAKFSCSEDVVSIIRIDSNFGTKIFTIVADIYISKDAKDATAVKRKKELEATNKVEEEKKKAEAEVAKPIESKDNSQEDTEEVKKEVVVPEGALHQVDSEEEGASTSPSPSKEGKESPEQGEVSAPNHQVGPEEVGLEEGVPSEEVKEGKEKLEEKLKEKKE